MKACVIETITLDWQSCTLTAHLNSCTMHSGNLMWHYIHNDNSNDKNKNNTNDNNDKKKNNTNNNTNNANNANNANDNNNYIYIYI